MKGTFPAGMMARMGASCEGDVHQARCLQVHHEGRRGLHVRRQDHRRGQRPQADCHGELTHHPARESGAHGAPLSRARPSRQPASCSARARSAGVVTLNARSSPVDADHAAAERARPSRRSRWRPPRAPRAPRAARASGKPCGVCTARRAPRSSVSATLPSGADALDGVGQRRGPARRPRHRRAAPATTRSTSSGGASGRAASCTSTNSARVGHAGDAGRDRLGPRRAARHRGGDLRRAEVVGEQRGALLVLLRARP